MVLAAVAVATSCGGTDETPLAGTTPASDKESSVDAPDDGERRTFCEAFAAVPMRWVDDAVLPLSIWADTWGSVDDVPSPAQRSVVALQDFAQQRLDWNLGRLEERPVYDETLAEHTVAIADAAVAGCPDLPMVVGPPSQVALEPLSDEVCAERVASVEEAIDAYVARRGREPGHIAQLDAEAFVAFAFGEGALFFADDTIGVDQRPDGTAVAVPVPGGACDR